MRLDCRDSSFVGPVKVIVNDTGKEICDCVFADDESGVYMQRVRIATRKMEVAGVALAGLHFEFPPELQEWAAAERERQERRKHEDVSLADVLRSVTAMRVRLNEVEQRLAILEKMAETVLNAPIDQAVRTVPADCPDAWFRIGDHVAPKEGGPTMAVEQVKVYENSSLEPTYRVNKGPWCEFWIQSALVLVKAREFVDLVDQSSDVPLQVPRINLDPAS